MGLSSCPQPTTSEAPKHIEPHRHRCWAGDEHLGAGPFKDYIQTHGGLVHYSTQVKPITHLKAHAAEVLLQIAERREPMVITQNGEAKAVLQDVASYEETQETLALLKLLAIGNRQVEEGKTSSLADVAERLRTGIQS